MRSTSARFDVALFFQPIKHVILGFEVRPLAVNAVLFVLHRTHPHSIFGLSNATIGGPALAGGVFYSACLMLNRKIGLPLWLSAVAASR